MLKLAIMWVLGLVGCTPMLAADLLQVSMTGALSGLGERDRPKPICADVAAGPALNACFAAHGVRSAQLAEVAHRREAARAHAIESSCIASATDETGQRLFDRELVATGLASAHAGVVACGDSLEARGEVVLQMTVAGSGCVTAVAIESTPNRELGTCVATAVQRAAFEPSQTGGTFRYRYDF